MYKIITVKNGNFVRKKWLTVSEYLISQRYRPWNRQYNFTTTTVGHLGPYLGEGD